MEDIYIEDYKPLKDRVKQKTTNFMADIWPWVYKNVNNSIWAVWKFLKDTVASVFRRYS